MLHTKIKMALEAGLLPLLIGKFGIGKSATVRAVAEEMNLKVVPISLGSIDPSILSGYPIKDTRQVGDQQISYATHLVDDMFVLAGQELPYIYDKDGQHVLDSKGNKQRYSGVLYFFDEITSAMPHVQSLAYMILQDKEVGRHKLHENTYMVAAGNRSVDAGAAKLTEGILTRCCVIECNVDVEGWLAWANSTGLHPAVRSYIQENRSKLDQYPEKASERAGAINFAVSRTWDNLSKLLEVFGTDLKKEPLLGELGTGCIGKAAWVDFIVHLTYFADLPKLADILKQPSKADLPDAGAMRHAMRCILEDNLIDNPKDCKATMAYMQRWEQPEHIVSLLTTVLAANDEILDMDDTVADWIMSNRSLSASIKNFKKGLANAR